MRIPKQIKVGGHKIRVEVAATDRAPRRGSYNDYHNLILLEKEGDTPEDNLAEALLHEILEAIKAKNNLDLDHTSLTVLSEALFQILRDNPLDFKGS